jgi:gamma-glutamyl-gamma-aminobutyrate hydrolase PuuD
MTNTHAILISGAMPSTKSVATIMSAMRMAGSTPILIANHKDYLDELKNRDEVFRRVEEDLLKVNGVIIMGNDYDIDPKDYKDEFLHPKTNAETKYDDGKVRRLYEYILIEKTLEHKIPCLAICGGMQRLNVFLGGSLHQHIPDLINGNEYHNQANQNIAPFIPVQYVKVIEGTLLAEIGKEALGLFTPQYTNLPEGVFMENSFHHQAVKNLGSDLLVSAYSIEKENNDAEIIQAVESLKSGKYSNQFLLGLQWHPEFGASEVSIRCLQNFNNIAAQHSKNFPRNLKKEDLIKNILFSEDINLKNIFNNEKSDNSAKQENKKTKKGKGK